MSIGRSAALTESEAHAVRALGEEVRRADGAPPLTDQGLVRLRSRGGRTQHFRSATGYAQATSGPSAVLVELVVGTEGDRVTTADELLDAVTVAFADKRLLAWSHGPRTPVAEALVRHGFGPVRALLKMARPLDDRQPEPLPDGITLRPFQVGRDEAAWLGVNARAFAHHPEQADASAADLAALEQEEWFDPAGFLLAEDTDGTLLGFHWTKLHRGSDPPVGEVYVLGVDPAAQGRRLGGALLDAGLRHLRSRGAAEVMLFTDESNDAAVRLYQKRGFASAAVDTQYERPAG